MGAVLYIFIALFLMGSGQWGKPQTFYVKYHGPHLAEEIEALKNQQEYIKYLKKYMIARGWYKEIIKIEKKKKGSKKK